MPSSITSSPATTTTTTVYDEGAPRAAGTALAVAPPPAIASAPAQIDITQVTQAVLEQIKEDPCFAERVAE